MKGYIVNSKCYVFPQEVGQIPAVEAEVIYVQEENFAAWLAANESVADKLKKYNYNVMTVKPKEWADHTDDDLEPEPGPTPTTYTITYDGAEYVDHDMVTSAAAGDTVTVYLKDTSTFEPVGGHYTPYASYDDGEYHEIEVSQTDAFTYQFTMPADDATFGAGFEPPVFNLTVSGPENQHVDFLGQTEASAGSTIELGIADGDQETFTFDTSASGKTILAINWTGIEASDATYESEYDRWTFTMPANAVNAEAVVYTP